MSTRSESWAVLRLSGEYQFPVTPLRVPGAVPVSSADSLLVYDAVRLFAERARAVRPTFSLDDQNSTAVAEICRQLGGLPLAIELAAERTKLFPPTWEEGGRMVEGAGWLERALAACQPAPVDLRAEGMRRLSLLAHSRGDHDRAALLQRQCLRIYREREQ